MKKVLLKKIVIVTSVVFLVGLSTYAFAGRGGFGSGMGHGHMINGGGYMMNDLSEEDQKKMNDLRDSFLKETEETTCSWL